MRRTSLTLGLSGGAAGIGVHAYLLAQLLQQVEPSPSDVKSLAVGIALGAASVAASLAARVSRPVSAAFLLSLGALGLFPNPLTWAPAGALLIVAGVLALLDMRRSVSGVVEQPVNRDAAQPAARPSAARPSAAQAAAPATAHTAPDGTPLHWSVLSHPLRGAQTPPPQMGLAPATAHPTTGPGAPRDQSSWTTRSKVLVVVSVIAATLVVVPFSLWPRQSVAAASELLKHTSTTVAAVTGQTTTTAPSDGSSTTAPAEQVDGSSTTVATAFSRVGSVDPGDPGALVLYSNQRFGLTVSLPAGWLELPASNLADYHADFYHLAAFADAQGPTLQNAFLNGLTIQVVAGSQTEDPPQELVQQSLQKFLDQGPEVYDYFKVLKPIQETTVGGVTALKATARITWNERVMVKSVYTFVANHCLYRIDLQTDDVDWDEYKDAFDKILQSFTFTPDGAAQ